MTIEKRIRKAMLLSSGKRIYNLDKGWKFRNGFPKRGISCVYVLAKDEEIIYVGCSTNFNIRIQGHNEKDFSTSYFVKFKSHSEALYMEKRAIIELNPKLNIQYNQFNR